MLTVSLKYIWKKKLTWTNWRVFMVCYYPPVVINISVAECLNIELRRWCFPQYINRYMDCIRFLKSEIFWVLKNNLTSRVRIKVPGLYQTEERANSQKKKKRNFRQNNESIILQSWKNKWCFNLLGQHVNYSSTIRRTLDLLGI